MSPVETRPARRYLAVVAAALLTWAASGCGEREGSRARLERAEHHRSAGQLREALIELKDALRSDPQNPEINYRIASALQQKGESSDALFYYGEAHRIDPARSDAPLAMAKLLLFEDPERSGRLIDGVLARTPEAPLAHIRRSELALAAGDALRALDAAQRAVELASESPEAFRQLGVVGQAQIRERQLRNLEPDPALHRAALDAYARVIELRRGRPVWRAHLLRARILAAWPGHHGDAVREFRAAARDAALSGHAEARTRAIRSAWEFARSSGDRKLERESLEDWVSADPAALAAWRRLAQLSERWEGSGDAVYQRLLAGRPRDVDAHLAWVDFLQGRERWDEALAVLDRLRQRGLDPPRRLAARARLLYRADRGTEAQRVVQQLRAEYPDHPSSALLEAESALREGHLKAAAAALRSLRARRDDPEVERMLAWVELRLGRPSAARAAIDRAIGLEAVVSAASLRLRARIRAASADWSGALESLRERAQQFGRPTSADRTLRARCLYELGRADEARAVLSRLLAADPPPTQAVLEFAAREAQLQPERVRERLEAALSNAPEHRALLAALTDLDLTSGDWHRALERLDRRAASADAPRASDDLLRARVFAFAGDLESAARAAGRALATEPELPAGGRVLAAILQRQGRLPEAIAALEQGRQRGGLKAVDLGLLGRLYSQRGDDAAARAALEEALSRADAPPDAANALAYLLARQGAQLDRALQLAVSARRRQPDDPHAADTLGYVYLKSGLPDSALGQFREALRLARAPGTGRGTYHYHAALALDALGRPTQARAAVEAALAEREAFPQIQAARAMLDRSASGAARLPSSPSAATPALAPSDSAPADRE